MLVGTVCNDLYHTTAGLSAYALSQMPSIFRHIVHCAAHSAYVIRVYSQHSPSPPALPQIVPLSLFRPLAFLLASSFRPFLVLILDKNPCLRFWISRLDGFILWNRGPQRICVPRPARAGCAEMADLGMRSGEATSDVVVLVGTSLERTLVGARKAAGGEETVGRRVGREEKDLDCVSYEVWRQSVSKG